METQNELSERAVIDWLKWKATTYGIPGLYLKIEDTEDSYPCIARTTTDDGAFGCGNTFDDAVTMIRPRIKTPQCKADELRQQAAKLLEKSNKILGVHPWRIVHGEPFLSQGAGSSQEDASAAREGAAGSAKEVRHV